MEAQNLFTDTVTKLQVITVEPLFDPLFRNFSSKNPKFSSVWPAVKPLVSLEVKFLDKLTKMGFTST